MAKTVAQQEQKTAERQAKAEQQKQRQQVLLKLLNGMLTT